MKTTANYGLKKPDGTDVVNIDDFNYNADVIDQRIKEVDNKASNITVPVTSVNGKTGAVTLAASEVGAVPTGRKINNKPLSADIVLNANDIKTSSGTTVESELAQLTKKNDYVANNGFAKTSGTATAYTLTLNPTPVTYVDGMGVTIVPHIDCGVNPTLNINGLGATPLLKSDGTNFTTGELKINKPYSFVRVGSNFFIRSSSGGSFIKSIQRGSYVFTKYDWSKDIDINSININSSIIRLTCNVVGWNNYVYSNQGNFRGEFLNGNRIKLSRYYSSNSLVYEIQVDWEVIEFYNVKTKQIGISENPQSEELINVSKVNPNKSMLFFTGISRSDNDKYTASYLNNVRIIDSETIKINLSSPGKQIAWELIEFN